MNKMGEMKSELDRVMKMNRDMGEELMREREMNMGLV